MGSRAGLDRCGKSRLHRDSIPGPPSPQPVAIPTMIPGPLPLHVQVNFNSTGYPFMYAFILIQLVTLTCKRLF